jgi:hypothetical protein
MKTRVLILTGLLAIAGCAGVPENFVDYPKPLTKGESVKSNSAIVLVGISGPVAVDYIQFGHSTFPAINAKFPAQGDTIVAIPIATGVKQLAIWTITLAGRPGFYIGSMPVGYIPVKTRAIDIDRPGIYYLATLDTSKPGASSPEPNPEQLLRLRETLGDALAGLQPVNFQWPEK